MPINGAAVLADKRLTVKQAAGLLNCCTKSVLTRIKANKISPIIRNAGRGPGAIEIPLSSINAYRLTLVQGGRK